jgi:hypothetical protein
VVRYGRTMELSRTGRFVFVAQWPAALVFPAFLIVGRGLVGAELGWLAIIGILYGIVLIALMLVPPVLAVIDRRVREARRTRLAYDILTFVLWAAFLVAGVTAPDSSDAGHLRSAVTVWTGGAIDYDTAESIFAGALLAILLAWGAVVAVAIAGIVRGARGR